jgi:hypothetical protein
MKCRMTFSGSMTRIYQSTLHSVVHLAAVYVHFPECLSCFITYEESGDVHWHRLWYREASGDVNITASIPTLEVLDFVVSFRKEVDRLALAYS